MHNASRLKLSITLKVLNRQWFSEPSFIKSIDQYSPRRHGTDHGSGKRWGNRLFRLERILSCN